MRINMAKGNPAKGCAAKGFAIAIASAAVLATAACTTTSTSSSSSAQPPTTSAVVSPTPPPTAPPTSAPASTGASGSGASSGAVAQITTNWMAFFNSATPTSQRVMLLQNGSTFSSAISAFASNPLAANVTAKVKSVTVTSSTQATVAYDLDGPGGVALLANQSGTAVLESGTWKVGDASFCGLLTLAGGTLPSACKK